MNGYSGMLNAPTGFGKTYALWFGVLENYFAKKKRPKGLHCLWITPLRALSKEIYSATTRVSDELGLVYNIALRTRDTPYLQFRVQRPQPRYTEFRKHCPFGA